MVFRKTASTVTIGRFEADEYGQPFTAAHRKTAISTAVEGDARADAFADNVIRTAESHYLRDGAVQVNVKAILEKNASKYAISPDPRDHYYEIIRANTTEVPNGNFDAFTLAELLRFDTRLSMNVYETYKEKGHYVDHKCFRAGTLVVLANGSSKKIEDVRVGDRVLDKDGRAQTVEAAWDEGVPEVLTKITLRSYGEIFCTPNHKFPVWAWPRDCRCGCGLPTKPGKAYASYDHCKRGRVATELEYVDGTTKSHGGARRIPEGYEPRQKLEAGDIRASDFLLIPAPFEAFDSAPQISQRLDKVRARLLGYYVAEGCDAYKGTAWTFGAHEENTWASDVVALCDELTVTAKAHKGAGYRNTCVVRTYTSQAAEELHTFFGTHGGKYAQAKRLSTTVVEWPVDLKIELIRGMFRGDGSQHYIKHTKTSGQRHSKFTVAYTTVSRALAEQTRMLLSQLGIPTSLEHTAQPNPAHSDKYVIRCFGKFAKRLAKLVWEDSAQGQEIEEDLDSANHLKVVDGFIHVPVKAVEFVTNDQRVYNLTISGSHSYQVSGGIATFNSSIPKMARGVILDAHYNNDRPPLEECRSCHSKTASLEGRDPTGIYCRKCGSVVKDEFVEILIAIDSKKDPPFAEGVRSGLLRYGSMGCFIPGTPVTMADGTRCPIEKINEGDRVITHSGKVAQVKETSVHDHESDVYRISIQGIQEQVVATGNHPFWVVDPATGQGTWVEADKLKIGQYLRCPSVKYETVPVENDFARLVGYFLSEGNFIKAYDGPHIGKRVGIEFTFSLTEKHYAEELVRLIEKYGNRPSVYERPTRGSLVVKDYRCIKLAERLFELVGQHAVDKTLSSEILAWPREAQLHLVGTWLNGDGSSIDDGAHSWCEFVTSSANLKDQLSLLLANLGIAHRFGTMKSSFGGRDASRIYVSGNAQLLLRGYSDKVKRTKESVHKTDTQADKHGLLRKIKAIEIEEYAGPVYNFEVDDEDHSYIAGGVAVHNCTCSNTICNVCDHVAYAKPDFCEHIASPNKGSYWIKARHATALSGRFSDDTWRKISRHEAEHELKKRGLKFVEADFCRIRVAATDRLPPLEIRKAYERCNGVIFDEYSGVGRPADEKAEQEEMLRAAALSSTGAFELEGEFDLSAAIAAETAHLIASVRARARPDNLFSGGFDMTQPRARITAAELHRQAQAQPPMPPIPNQPAAPAGPTPGAVTQPLPGTEAPPPASEIGPGAGRTLSKGVEVTLPPGAKVRPEGRNMVIEMPLEEGAEALTSEPGPGADPGQIEPVQDADDDANGEPMTPEEMGIMPPGASKQGSDRERVYTERHEREEAEKKKKKSEEEERKMFEDHSKEKHQQRNRSKMARFPYLERYAKFVVRPTPAGNMTLIDPDGSVLGVISKTSAMSATERTEYGKGVMRNLLSNGLVHTLGEYPFELGPRVAQVIDFATNDMEGHQYAERFHSVNEGSVVDHVDGERTRSNSVGGTEPEPADWDGESRHEDSSVTETSQGDIPRDNAGIEQNIHQKDEDDRQDTRPGETSNVYSEGEHDHVLPNLPSSKRKKRSALEQQEFEQAVAREASKAEQRVKKLYEGRVAKLQSQVNAKTAASESTSGDRMLKCLFLADHYLRIGQETSPLKDSLVRTLTASRIVGRDSHTGESLMFEGLDPQLANHLVTAALIEDDGVHIERTAQRACELMERSAEYLADAEAEVRHRVASLPAVSAASQLNSYDFEAEDMRRRASAGNPVLNSAPLADDAPPPQQRQGARLMIRQALNSTQTANAVRNHLRQQGAG